MTDIRYPNREGCFTDEGQNVKTNNICCELECWTEENKKRANPVIESLGTVRTIVEQVPGDWEVGDRLLHGNHLGKKRECLF